MKVSFQNIDFEAVTRFWNECYPARYRIDAELLRLNTVESAAFDWGCSYVEQADGEILGFVIVKRSASALYRGPDPDEYHLSAIAYREPEYGVDLLADVKRLLRNRGGRTLAFGRDSRHFFPGCPKDAPALGGFLMVEGFVASDEVIDLERDLGSYENPFPAPQDGELRVLTDGDLPALDAFLESEFPGRWHHDVMGKVAKDGPGCVMALMLGDRVGGFALIQTRDQQLPISGAVWRADLGENWGALGPIGVRAELRGQGRGHALLGAALSELKRRGARRTIIDWTTLEDFYGKHGFEVSRRYTPMTLRLDS